MLNLNVAQMKGDKLAKCKFNCVERYMSFLWRSQIKCGSEIMLMIGSLRKYGMCVGRNSKWKDG